MCTQLLVTPALAGRLWQWGVLVTLVDFSSGEYSQLLVTPALADSGVYSQLLSLCLLASGLRGLSISPIDSIFHCSIGL